MKPPPASTASTSGSWTAVNRSGEIFLSHTRLADRYTIRVSIGNPRTQLRHLENGWRLLREAATRVMAEGR